MTVSADCYKLVQASEGCALAAYLCPAGIPTIGYGHTAGVLLGTNCTPAQASAWLAEDLHFAEDLIGLHVTVPLTQGEFDALASLIFNVGPGARGGKDGIVTLGNGQPSTLLRKLNSGDYSGAADEFPKWCHAGGQVLPGLAVRRARERALFLGEANFMAAA
jgi:lysozyme